MEKELLVREPRQGEAEPVNLDASEKASGQTAIVRAPVVPPATPVRRELGNWLQTRILQGVGQLVANEDWTGK